MKFSPVLRFGVMSDVHYTEDGELSPKRFESAVKCLYEYANGEKYKGVDALYVVGDFADTGTRGQMERFKNDCDKYVSPDTKLVLTLANHELHYGESEEKALEDFSEVFKMDFDRHEVIKGFHFISVTTTNDGGEWHDSFDDAKRAFLSRELEKAAAEGNTKPIFVFQHPGIRNTSPGAAYGNVGIDDILKDYPCAIDFAGHSHMAANDPREIHQRDFTVVGTGSIAGIATGGWRYKHLNRTGYRSTECSQMVVVEVDAEGLVCIKIMDCAAQKIFGKENFVDVSLGKEGFTYTDSRRSEKPCFAEEPCAELCREGENLRVRFPRAFCDDGIWYYSLKFLNEKGKEIAEINPISDHAMFYQKDSYDLTFENLPDEISGVEIRAVGFFENISEPIFAKLK